MKISLHMDSDYSGWNPSDGEGHPAKWYNHHAEKVSGKGVPRMRDGRGVTTRGPEGIYKQEE